MRLDLGGGEAILTEDNATLVGLENRRAPHSARARSRNGFSLLTERSPQNPDRA